MMPLLLLTLMRYNNTATNSRFNSSLFVPVSPSPHQNGDDYVEYEDPNVEREDNNGILINPEWRNRHLPYPNRLIRLEALHGYPPGTFPSEDLVVPEFEEESPELSSEFKTFWAELWTNIARYIFAGRGNITPKKVKFMPSQHELTEMCPPPYPDSAFVRTYIGLFQNENISSNRNLSFQLFEFSLPQFLFNVIINGGLNFFKQNPTFLHTQKCPAFLILNENEKNSSLIGKENFEIINENLDLHFPPNNKRKFISILISLEKQIKAQPLTFNPISRGPLPRRELGLIGIILQRIH